MRIIKICDQSESAFSDKVLVQRSLRGRRISPIRIYFLRNLDDGKITIVSLNIFERISWTIQEFFGRSYAKFDNFFHTKNIKIITPSEMNLTTSKVEIQAEKSIDSQPEPTPPVQPPQLQPEPTPAQEIQNHIQKGNLEEAVRATQNLPFSSQPAHFCAIARAYFIQDKLDKAIEILDSNFISLEIRSPVYRDLAISCCQKARFTDSIKVIEKISTSNKDKLVEEIFLEVANEYYQKGDLDKAREIIGPLKDFNGSGGEDFAIVLSEAYIQKGELDKAAETLSSIIYSSEERNRLQATLARKYYVEKNNLEKTLEYILFESDFLSAKALYLRVAQDYKKQGDTAKALSVLSMVIDHGRLVDIGHKAIIRNFIAQGNFDRAFEGIVGSNLRR